MLYTVQDTTMTALGDAVRSKSSQTKIVDEVLDLPITIDLNTDTVNLDEWVLNSSNYYTKSEVIYINGASAFSITTSYQCESLGAHDVFVYFANTPIYEEIGRDYTVKKLTEARVENSVSKITNTKGYKYLHIRYTLSKVFINDTAILHSEILPLDQNDEVMSSHKVEVKNTMTPAEMVENINNLMTIPDEALNITGNCDRRFTNGSWDWFLKRCGDKVTTNNINNITYMFGYCLNLEEIPFDINMISSEASAGYTFISCNKLRNIPMIHNLKISSGGSPQMFTDCYRIRNFPVGFADDWDFSAMKLSTYGGMNSCFSNCYSLREVPKAIIANCCNKSTSSYSVGYYSLFIGCYTLDEVNGLEVAETTYTSNCFNYTFNTTTRLKNLTFAVNEDGTPKTANWKNQTIDLSGGVGWLNYSYYKANILNYNSGITADKEVTDDTTYASLKDDPDWFTCDVNYSRYNHDSAVNTINSLPDCSSSGGANTIKFKGASGALTDGGAINTLTEEEIAIATAKGWTVSLV